MAKMNIVKQVPLSKQIISLAEERTEELGINFPEYVRHLILQDTKRLRENLPMATKEEEIQIMASMKDLDEGNYHEFSSPEEIEEHFGKLFSDMNAE